MGVTYFMQTETVQYRGYKSKTVHILLYIERFRHILGRISAYNIRGGPYVALHCVVVFCS